MSKIRTRWAAIGAAVAVTVGAGGAGLVGATRSTGERASYETVTACRVLDTRANKGIGGRTSPLGAGETLTVLTDGGNCSNLPDGTAVALNVTAIGATELTHLTIWDAGPVPTASSLNPSPGQPPTPNAVTTPVDANGAFRIFNFAGSVDVVIDLVGVFSEHDHGESKVLSFQPKTLAAFGGATPVSGGITETGLALDDSPSPGFEVAFRVPNDYTANTFLFLDVMWHIGQHSCGIAWQPEYAYTYRYDKTPASADFEVVGGDSTPSSAEHATTTYFRVEPVAGLRAGDSVVLGLSRQGASAADSCTTNVIVTGVSVTYV